MINKQSGMHIREFLRSPLNCTSVSKSVAFRQRLLQTSAASTHRSVRIYAIRIHERYIVVSGSLQPQPSTMTQFGTFQFTRKGAASTVYAPLKRPNWILFNSLMIVWDSLFCTRYNTNAVWQETAKICLVVSLEVFHWSRDSRESVN